MHGQLPQEQVYAGIGSDVSDEFKCHIPRHQELLRHGPQLEYGRNTVCNGDFRSLREYSTPGPPWLQNP